MTDPLLRLETQGIDIVITPAGHACHLVNDPLLTSKQVTQPAKIP